MHTPQLFQLDIFGGVCKNPNLRGANLDDPDWIAVKYSASVGWVSAIIPESIAIEEVSQECFDWLSGLSSGDNPYQNS